MILSRGLNFAEPTDGIPLLEYKSKGFVSCQKNMNRLLIAILLLLLSVVSLYFSFTFWEDGLTSNLDPTDSTSQFYPRYEEIEIKECQFGELIHGMYCVLPPVRGEHVGKDTSPVTLSTQGTLEFLHHIAVLCKRWSGPVSLAVYTTEGDYRPSRVLANTLRQCDSCIRHWVSWHFFHHKDRSPDYEEVHETVDCPLVLSRKWKTAMRPDDTYPINVGRNLARKRSLTPYVLSSDIELYPSLGVITKFERMLRTTAVSPGPQVWVLPTFEVTSQVKAPMTKGELRILFLKKKAVSFHRYRCDVCHRIPSVRLWMEKKGSTQSEVAESLESLRVWRTVKRSRRFRLQFWEPFFIGSKSDPEFDIRLSWEGKQNKMQMAYEMCLLSYDFHILENAFFVHAPGINVYNATYAGEQRRRRFTDENDRLIRERKWEAISRYGYKEDC